ncbi:MAG: hypothetical protein A3G52_02920 [Candidatus Taylorbacteria bacterium RIFCSPLOWO2_12_FULL_43_20]|uniref:ATP-dependent Clp protease proteolytic subunit n=1 Tax=Candidatus Taylorbacteria bacterium RIFCSPLOWO2_12_FULL_43_20 TaxID=1802332 RepID=A0A1G2P376_9BACT|nr:MAG: hypothetical protein A2825_03965 [Candidatus Taylorbacteria bacterium RIFCSPHIGHO2_01_FULL_43_120]OHA24192.1 MAG: hypothetical protein A3B98_00020 [Candidatus Taylorbacteria bacterium RIFCSPHIGHO2_02_FULL_43_55]OHA28161.1 MAG: hypothetical protein A3E92_02060 [Candidatus Taylorbacteria bacterium RIFCSPHIGHO2_12_FULL_42_34]OHA32187.1 MAG: hypothetical protein A3B09_00895 [Candidatus Taylorbacteria bacterium RIFCSPLOWO2_01_FULL_43_83]OHA39697.1 MAG: hypothetical protein A3H58_04545 [Candi
MSITRTKTKISAPEGLASSYVLKMDRAVEWLGAVTYANFEKVLKEIKLKARESKEEEITLFINSPGGATGIAMSFYDSMRLLGVGNLTTIGSGDVDSSGIIVFLAGKKRFLTKKTTLLLHLAGRTFDPSQRFTTVEMESMLKEDKLKDYYYACVISDNSNGKVSTAEVLGMMANNTILTPDKAVRIGIAHGVLD